MPRPLPLEPVPASQRSPRTLPFELRPARGRTVAALVDWIAEHRAPLEEQLVHHGALRFRGFDIPDATAFEQVARAFEPALKNDYLGTSPRDALSGHVFTASELPGFYPIPQHNEMSFLRGAPDRLFFACLQPNDGVGGETPLCDMRHVWRDLDPAVRDRFQAKGVRTVRNYTGPEARQTRDLWQLKRWDEMFRTTDRAAIESRCAEQGIECHWRDDGRLTLVTNQPAAKPHPVTGEPTWFNHTQVFHLSAAPGEYRRILALRPHPKWLGLALFARVMVAAKRFTTATGDHAMEATFGDGSPISDRDAEAVRDAIWKNLRIERWQRGDVVVIDNHAVAHGRLPYTGPRLVAVAWS